MTMSSTQTQYGMVIDTRRCFGCQTCTISCKISNQVPADIHLNHLESLDGDTLYRPTGSFPNTKLAFRPCLCNHCASPLCVANCPTGAMHKDEATGIVRVETEVCIGCGTCANSCPYGAPSIDKAAGKSRKCDLCFDRLADNKDPYCVQACPGFARKCGNIADTSGFGKQLQGGEASQHEPGFGTDPSVYYVI
jgi:Fe-S-cluster-containing dehydrogenase component